MKTLMGVVAIMLLNTGCNSTDDTPQEQKQQQNQVKNDADLEGALIYESFENGGWNAPHARGFKPGLNEEVPANFMFNQHQGEHSFVLENKIVRHGKHAAKLVWNHKDLAAYNGNPNKVDNVDRKAMFHGFKTSDVMGAEA